MVLFTRLACGCKSHPSGSIHCHSCTGVVSPLTASFWFVFILNSFCFSWRQVYLHSKPENRKAEENYESLKTRPAFTEEGGKEQQRMTPVPPAAGEPAPSLRPGRSEPRAERCTERRGERPVPFSRRYSARLGRCCCSSRRTRGGAATSAAL